MVIKDLEEENEKLSTRCADLLNDLEKLRKEEAHWRKEKYSVDAKIKVWGENGIYAVILDRSSTRSEGNMPGDLAKLESSWRRDVPSLDTCLQTS